MSFESVATLAPVSRGFKDSHQEAVGIEVRGWDVPAKAGATDSRSGGELILRKWKPLLGSLLLVTTLAGSALAGSKDAMDAKTPAENAASAAPQPASGATPNVAVTGGSANVTALLGVLVMKGVLAPAEANAIRNAAPDAEFQMLVEALTRKGLVSAEELSVVSLPRAKPVEPAQAPSAPAKPPAPKVIPAVAPLRVLQLEPSKPEGMVPDLKLGTGARLKVYGMVKTSVIYDTSSPYGTDMPLPGFLTASSTTFDPGPTRRREFHAKARFARIGTNFEWPDVAGSNNAITGKREVDFEGYFSRALNRNISTIRSSMASIRLAYGRIDHRFNDNPSMFALFGQDPIWIVDSGEPV